ncbi:MAG TPA: FAD-dependent oxidoreductase [Anaerolineales bacterium]|nr:FAD-dependent oxidoreductase [Anaerolineales bacterium]
MPTAPSPPAEVDVAIVGSGYTGLNAARVLVKSGARTVVLERNSIGSGASSRNGGMATPGIKQSLANIVKRYGKARGESFWQASLGAIDLIEQIVREENIDCDWVRNGHIALANRRPHFERLRVLGQWYKQEFGHETTLVSQADLHSEIGTGKYYGGLADEISGGLHPAKYVFGLARAVAQHGAHLCENTDVTRINRHAGGFHVHTNRGVLYAREVLVATNGYTDHLVQKLKPRIFSVGSYIIVTEPLSPELQERLSPKRRMFYDTKWFLNYFRLTPDGRMLWGGRNDLSTDMDLYESANRLRNQMGQAFPELRVTPITHSWTGQLGLTFDLMPHIGRVDGIHYALGYCGHGLSIATYLGTEVGLMLSGQKTGSPFAEISHSTMLFYRNKPWFLPFVASYYRFLDQVT